jgi:hypothetical protein
MSAPCSRSASASPVRSTPTTSPKSPARPAATPASASSKTAASLAGVQAGRAGTFGYVVGVDRVGQAQALREHGADVVVEDLAELIEDDG